jgi:hypothetical protein
MSVPGYLWPLTDMKIPFLFILLLAGLPTAAGTETTLRSDNLILHVGVAKPLDFSLATGVGPIRFENAAPLAIDIVQRGGPIQELRGAYTSVLAERGTLNCQGELRSPAGSIFQFRDVFSAGRIPRSYVLSRDVTISKSASADEGFASEFSLLTFDGSPLSGHDVFIPGLCYRDNTHVPARALAANFMDRRIWIREDRMPLPLIMLWDRKTRTALTLVHLAQDGGTCAEDVAADRLVDTRLQFASLGITSPEHPAATFRFPGTEADRTYLRRRSDPVQRGAERFHPVRSGVPHHYQILIAAAEQPSFPTAMRDAWRTAYAMFAPPIAKVDVTAVYRASMDLVTRLSRQYNDSPGLPFRVHLPAGDFEPQREANFQMGFVGQQLPLGYHLLRYGLVDHHEHAFRQGEAIVDFWAKNSLTPEGLPRTWFDPYPQPHWRNYPTYLRGASDGMAGALAAWNAMARHGHPKPEWLRFCRGYGDWLIAHQQEDGSWFRGYDFSGEPLNNSKHSSTHPIRFLVDLAKATGDMKYASAARRAGEYCLRNIHETFAYVGGTVDNPNVLDKEAGFLAFAAFLALYDETRDVRYLRAAEQAADFAETWVYAWPLPVLTSDSVLPAGRSIAGFSLIATGGSGADLFMAGAPFLYLRLSLFTGDSHYADVARLLMYNPRQFVDVGGSLGYKFPGLCTEAMTFAPPRRGVNTWLPWLTYSMVEPIVQTDEVFGPGALDPSLATNLPALKAKNEAFGRRRGISAYKPE